MTKFRKNGYAETTRIRAEIDKLSKCMEDKKAKALANGVEVWCSFDELVPTERLLDNPKNPNRHPEAQVELLGKNIKYFGAGKNLSDAKKPFVKTFEFNNKKINLYVFCGYIYRKEYDLEYNFYAQENKEGVFDLNTDILREDIKKIKLEDKNSYIVIFPHYGSDFQKTLPSQINLSRQLIDMGADIVIGHGPHMMNNMEYYKDKVILYSIGNFLFPVDFKKKPVPYNLIAEIELYEKDNEIKINNNLYPIYIPNNSMLPLPRVINENEIDETINYLSENNPEVKDKIKIEKGEFICIKL